MELTPLDPSADAIATPPEPPLVSPQPDVLPHLAPCIPALSTPQPPALPMPQTRKLHRN